MGIWGSGSFDNDDAADWLENLLESQELSQLYEAFDDVTGDDAPDYLEITECCNAIAAAEIIAQISGSPTSPPAVEYNEIKKLAELLSDNKCKLKLINLALKGADRILNDEENSELRQVWEEDEQGFALWAAAVEDLMDRLRKAGQGLNL